MPDYQLLLNIGLMFATVCLGLAYLLLAAAAVENRQAHEAQGLYLVPWVIFMPEDTFNERGRRKRGQAVYCFLGCFVFFAAELMLFGFGWIDWT